MNMVYCGIDPGLGGAVGFVTAEGVFHAVADMPVLPTSTGRRVLDAAGLADVLRTYRPAFVLVERVGARPGEGATGAFSFGHTFGGILGVLGALGLAHDLIQPAVWKRKAGIPPGADKAVSVLTAKRLLPCAARHLTRAKDDGRAESLLLALQAWERRARRACEKNLEKQGSDDANA